ncbi:hypothetical protein [Nitrosotalea sinensis]|nr:hypothetical protein [Candidatus Nitrosotalea sinensis]
MAKKPKQKKLFARKISKKTHRVLKIDFDKLTPKQNANYEDSLVVLNKIKYGLSLTVASKQVGISPQTVKRYVGSALKLQNHKWIAKSLDRLLREVRIYEKGKQVWITVRGIKQAKIIGQYHSAIGRLSQGQSVLKPFTKIKIKDASGKIHHLETDITKILAILEQQEDAEFYSIYGRK